MIAIRKSVALLLCSKIRQDNRCRWFTLSGLTCKLCMHSSKGEPTKMRLYKNKKYDGCPLVNKWYAKLNGSDVQAKFDKIVGSS